MRITSILIVFLSVFHFSFAQELKIKYNIIMESSDPAMQPQLQMSKGSTLTVFAKGEQSRVEMKMGQLMTTTTILDVNKKKGLTLMEGMLGKQAATFEGEDFDTYHGEDNDAEIEFLDETKTILGHKCKKAIVYIDEEGGEMVFWYTEDVKANYAFVGDYSKYGLPGVALEYGVEQESISMKFVATELNTNFKADKNLFDLNIPAGYTEKSFKEMINMSGQ
ncbi:hypothetical protein [Brumimicrobium oceani]|uniref:DUF4412 domain-containing protein n=1 Tax=Brumimicrobium oceani TaxID=2100725 RepID=A0A2U2XBW9_9FLAO|nr:hypothetical protein [Brumimicrobium oceani]PWH85296.1 hypothetical protein DIT68_10180 [Brumimicrobium oceani]